MKCRPSCGACCIAPSISRPYFGMPAGKKAGERCIHLTDEKLCLLFDDIRRPACCSAFLAEEWICGQNAEQAITILRELERVTAKL